jgi:putative holliday junction resolvase
VTDAALPGGRVLGIDYGSHRVGLAVSDSLRMTAQPLEVISRPAAVERISEVIAEMEIKQIVMGLPLGLSGREGPAARLARSFGTEITDATGLPVVFLDERFTTSTAESAMLSANVRRSRRRQSIDKVAAAVILQAFLDRSR